MKKIAFLSLIAVMTFIQCKKHDSTPTTQNNTLQSNNLFSVDTALVYPSSIVILKCNNIITKDTATISVGGQFVLIAKTDTFQYSMIVPVLSPGKYKMDLTVLNASNSPEITVGNYVPITNSATVLNTFSTQFKAIMDTLLNTKYKNLISVNDSTFLRQCMSQFNKNLQNATEAQKLAMAYYVKLIDITPANTRGSIGFDTSYMTMSFNGSFLATPKINGGQSIILSGFPYRSDELEVGEQLFKKAKETTRRVQIAVASILPVIGTGYLAIVQPETTPLFVLAFLNYRQKMLAAAECLGETVNMANIAEDVEPDAGINGNVLTINKNTSVWQKIKSKFRTINTKDANDPNFGEIISDETELQETDNKAKNKFELLKNLFSSFFDNITQGLNTYVSQIKSVSTEKLVEVNNRFITVSNISNPDITVSVVDDGSKGLKITVANPKNNIIANTPFSFNLNYVQAAFNNTVTVTEQANFIPSAAAAILSTTNISTITTTSAISGGNITSDGGSAITARGICWNTSTSPTIATNKTIDGSGTGNFVSNLLGLLPNTKYYVRAYATNTNGTFYGEEINFVTAQAQVPTITTSTLSNVNFSSATGGGNITADGGSPITARGICWSTVTNPTIANSKTTDGSGIGSFVSSVTGLLSSTTYYVRAYATNVTGTGYGNEVSFTTSSSNGRTGITIIDGNIGIDKSATRLQNPSDFFFDGNGNVYIADKGYNRIQKWVLGGSSGVTVAGVTVAGGNGTPSGSTSITNPTGVSVDAMGNIYISDPGGYRVQRWAPGATSGITVAGGNSFGSAANQLFTPMGVFVDSKGNVFVSDAFNNRVQKWTPGATSGITVAGGNGTGGGGSNANQLSLPTTFIHQGLWADVAGNIYVTDGGNQRVQKWAAGATTGVTVAGGNGVGSNANQLWDPTGIFVDANGNLYVVDMDNDRIQKWVPGATSGITVAGGNGRGSAANQFMAPAAVFIDASGNIYVLDSGNNRIQKWPPF